MGTVPESRLGKIEFYESHLPPWAASAVAIGTTAGAVSNLAILTSEARTAYDAHVAAQAAARAATADFYDKVTAMHGGVGAGSDMISTIRAFAKSSGDANVYVLAQIPPPATPGTVPPPGTPFDFKVELFQNGSVELKWKNNNPAGSTGTIYEVLRQIDGGAFVFVGNPGDKVFTDNTVPAGSAAVTYQVTATRSTARGNPAQFTVNFGANGATVTGESVTLEGDGGVSLAA
jgi:hypothetical protein